MLKHIFIVIAASAALISSCATQPPQSLSNCSNYDWYEFGRRDGARGLNLDRLEHFQNLCGEAFSGENQTMYLNGRNAALVEFCTPRNGFELGRLNIAYQAVCPMNLEEPFLQAYQKGTEARELELENKRISNRMNELSSLLGNLRAPNTEKADQLRDELEDLRRSRAQNEQQLKAIIK